MEKKPITSGSDASTVGGYQMFSVKGRSDQPKYLMRTQLSEQILAASTADTKKAKYVFRPPALKDDLGPLFKMSLDELLLHRLVLYFNRKRNVK